MNIVGYDKLGNPRDRDDHLAAQQARTTLNIKHDPTYLVAYRLLGNWVVCSCGWESAHYTHKLGAQHAFADHLAGKN